MKIIVLDGRTISQEDLSWDTLKALGTLEFYENTPAASILERIGCAEAVVTSKVIMSEEIMKACPSLKYIGSLATGYNNIDIAAAKRLGIAVTNIPAYSTDAVAQHTFALILEIANRVGLYNTSVSSGDWSKAEDFCYWKVPMLLLSGKTLGIVGYGSIGKKVGEIASAFGMKVHAYSREPALALRSDILSLHCPVTEENAGFVNKDFLASMKDGAILINTARGALINEADLAHALKSGKLAAAGLDVLSKEPPSADHPLTGLKNCFITPHIAWIPKEMRQTIIDVCAENLRSFLSGGSLNRVEQ